VSPSTSNTRLSLLSSFYTHAIRKCQLLQYNPIERPEPRKVGKYVGPWVNIEKKCAFLVAASTSKSSTGEIMPVAICIDEHTELLKRTGEPAAALDVQHLQEGAEIVVEGKKSKREVIHATRAVV
jgi:hypothetical protein